MKTLEENPCIHPLSRWSLSWAWARCLLLHVTSDLGGAAGAQRSADGPGSTKRKTWMLGWCRAGGSALTGSGKASPRSGGLNPRDPELVRPCKEPWGAVFEDPEVMPADQGRDLMWVKSLAGSGAYEAWIACGAVHSESWRFWELIENRAVCWCVWKPGLGEAGEGVLGKWWSTGWT